MDTQRAYLKTVFFFGSIKKGQMRFTTEKQLLFYNELPNCLFRMGI